MRRCRARGAARGSSRRAAAGGPARRRTPEGRTPVDGEVGGLELLDQPLARLRARRSRRAGPSGRPSSPRRGSAPSGGPRARYPGCALAPRGEDTGVDLRPEPEPAPPVAAVESDAAEPFVLRQLANGDLEYVGSSLVESHRRSIIICGAMLRSVLRISYSCCSSSRPSRRLASATPRRKGKRSALRLPGPGCRSHARSRKRSLRLRSGPRSAQAGSRSRSRSSRRATSLFQQNPHAAETIASVTKLFSTADGAPLPRTGLQVQDDASGAGATCTTARCSARCSSSAAETPTSRAASTTTTSTPCSTSGRRVSSQAGIHAVIGDLILNASFFDAQARHPEWPRDQEAKWYQAPVSALAYNDDVVLVSIRPGAPPRQARRPCRSIHRPASLRPLSRRDDRGERRGGARRRRAVRGLGLRHRLGHRAGEAVVVVHADRGR